ncbi:MAG: PKD domain-containing protein [Thermoplasmata archaeon]
MKISLVAGMILLSLVSVVVAVSGLASSSDASPPDNALSPEVRYSYHRLTAAEMVDMSGRFGVHDPSLDYNTIIDGYGTGLAPPSSEGWQSMVGSLNVLDSVEADMESIPSSLDLSTEPTFPAVGNQASQPSCAAWAATYYAYGFAEATDLGWTGASSGSPSQLISPGWTYNKVNGWRDSGSSMDGNMFVIRDWGAATLATMPYDDSEDLDWGSPSAFREAPEHRADEVFYIPYSGATTVDAIKALVSEGTLVTFGLDALQYDSGFADGNFILSAAEYSSYILNHAQTIVGFDDSVADDGEVGAFRVVNSWGVEWGDDGFYWFTYEAFLELGEMDMLYLNYITDIPDYSPELVAVWHFNDAPARNADIEVGLGPVESPIGSKIPFFLKDRSASQRFPTYMCLDVSEFSDDYYDSAGSFFLVVGPSTFKGVISSFKMEHHTWAYVPGAAVRTSAQSEDVPKATPGSVSVTLPQHDPVSASEALDGELLSFVAMGEVQWVGVNHASAGDGDSIQSGDVGDGEATPIAISVFGPAQVSFMWKVSSQSGSDVLRFEIPEAGVSESISGDRDWSERTYDIEDGVHTLIWSYSKDSGVSELEDTAWLDSIHVSAPLLGFSLEASYTATCGTPILVTPLDIHNPMSSELEFWFDWSDDSPMDPGNVDDGYSASHVYEEPGQYTLSVTMEDEYSNSIGRTAEVGVDDANYRPTIHSLEVDPAGDYYEPGSVVRFDVSVSDVEGDSVTVSVELPALGVVLCETDATDPGLTALFSLEYTCPLGSETAYEIVATVTDDAEHYLLDDWSSATAALLVNTPPIALVDVYSGTAVTGETIAFDASSSVDAETAFEALEARWDWESDGEWDTEWSDDLESSHAYPVPGSYVVTVELKDSTDLTSTATVEVMVTGEPIPEFPLVIVPVLAVVFVFAITGRRRRAGRH